MMGQINPAGFQSPMCMFYVYVIVEIKYFWLWLDFDLFIFSAYKRYRKPSYKSQKTLLIYYKLKPVSQA